MNQYIYTIAAVHVTGIAMDSKPQQGPVKLTGWVPSTEHHSYDTRFPISNQTLSILWVRVNSINNEIVGFKGLGFGRDCPR
jgi:hypothetical protein